MRVPPLLIAAALVLAACSKPAGQASEESAVAMAVPPGAPAVAAAAAAASAPGPSAAGPPQRTPVPPSMPMLAYRYDYAVAAPPGAIRRLVARHEAACQAAGPLVCQVIGSSISEAGPDRVSGKLSLRAQPAWLTGFRARLDGEASAAGGRLHRAEATSEDLSRQIVDTEAALRARSTLRDRLQALLATRPGKLSELLEVERELARVQGEIDATQSELAVMRARVATSELSIVYESEGVMAPAGVLAPLAQAFEDFLGIVIGVIAVLVRLLAYLLPLALLAALALWMLRNRLPRRRPKAPAAETDAPT